MAQLVQQRLRLLQILGVKAFGEPAVDLRQYVSGFFLLTLLLPHPRQAHRRSQLPRLRTLPASNVDSLVKIFLRLGLGVGC